MSISHDLGAKGRLLVAAAGWVTYLPVGWYLWSKVHLPLLMVIVFGLFCLLPVISIFVINVTARFSAHVSGRLLIATHCLLLLLVLVLFSAAEWVLHKALYAAAVTAVACGALFRVIRSKQLTNSIVDFSVGRLMLKLRLWTLAEIFGLFVIYGLSLLIVRRAGSG